LHPIVKILLAIILIAGSIWWLLQGSEQYINRNGLSDLKTVLNGAVPPMVFLLGLFILWLEWDEWKIERELASEEKKARKK